MREAGKAADRFEVWTLLTDIFVPRPPHSKLGLCRRGLGLYRRNPAYPLDSTDESNS
jgi:hypothetical protein